MLTNATKTGCFWSTYPLESEEGLIKSSLFMTKNTCGFAKLPLGQKVLNVQILWIIKVKFDIWKSYYWLFENYIMLYISQTSLNSLI